MADSGKTVNGLRASVNRKYLSPKQREKLDKEVRERQEREEKIFGHLVRKK